jgi:hypothetical protein
MTYKVFEAGETLSANDVMTYFMNQVVTQEATFGDLADLPADIKVAYVEADDKVYAKINGVWTALAYAGENGTFNNLTVDGNLTVNGTTTNISTTNLVVEDKNITLNDGGLTDASADGAGITIKGTTDKTFTWSDSTDTFNSSESINLAAGRTIKYNGTDIDVGAGYSLPSQAGNSGKFLTTNGTSDSWATISQYSLPSQTGNSGKLLSTNGTSESWSNLTLDEIQIQSVMDIY